MATESEALLSEIQSNSTRGTTSNQLFADGADRDGIGNGLVDSGQLNAELISDLFRVMLGRAPESNITIKNHLLKGTIAGVVEHIISSREFRDRISDVNKKILKADIQKLVDAQIGPWLSKKGHIEQPDKNINYFLNMENKIAFRIDGSMVEFMDKPSSIYYNTSRSDIFRDMLQNALRFHPVSLPCIAIIDVDDLAEEVLEFPVFSFQKKAGSVNVLLPDVDMISHDYLRNFNGDREYSSKQNKAIFAGATTGCRVITMDIAKNYSTKRLASEKYFRGSPLVDYRLPKIVQCESQDVIEYLEQQGLGRDPIGWDQMLENKFIMSVDGNGATCGRVALALYSNSALLKYESDYRLYYFDAMVPWMHYIPIINDEDVLGVINNEMLSSSRYEHIAIAGKSFALKYLNKESVYLYIGLLMEAYSQFYNGKRPN